MTSSIGLVALLLALVLLLLRLPATVVVIAIALAGVLFAETFGGLQGATGLQGGLAATSDHVAALLLDLTRTDALLMVPLFILLGNIAFYAGISTRIYDAASVWLRKVPGGLAMASVMGCGGFAAISGSSLACATTMGRICVPEMLRHGYDARLAASSVAVGGTLGALIPPSILFILFGLFTGTSVAQLFMAGLLPGLLSLAGMLVVIAIWAHDEPAAAPAAGPSEASRLDALIAIWPPLALLSVIIGGLSLGLLRPSMAAAICVALAILIGFAQKRLTAELLWTALRLSLRQTLSILFAVVAAKLFIGFLDLTGTSDGLVSLVQGWGLPTMAVLALVVVSYLLLGMFMEPMAILILTLPLTIPLIHAYGMDPIWFGVIVVKLLEIGLITPPVGLNVFVIGTVARDVGRDRIFAGVARFLMVDGLVLLALILFPVISTLIPSMMAP